MRRGAPHGGALQPCAPQKKKKAGPAGRGDVRRAGGGSGGPGVAPRPPCLDDTGSEPNRCAGALFEANVKGLYCASSGLK